MQTKGLTRESQTFNLQGYTYNIGGWSKGNGKYGAPKAGVDYQ